MDDRLPAAVVRDALVPYLVPQDLAVLRTVLRDRRPVDPAWLRAHRAHAARVLARPRRPVSTSCVDATCTAEVTRVLLHAWTRAPCASPYCIKCHRRWINQVHRFTVVHM